MRRTFKFSLPANVTPDTIKLELDRLTAGAADVEVRQSAKSGEKGRLGQIDPHVWEVVIQLLDTKAADAAVHSVLGAVMGYLFARTGTKPATRDEK